MGTPRPSLITLRGVLLAVLLGAAANAAVTVVCSFAASVDPRRAMGWERATWQGTLYYRAPNLNWDVTRIEAVGVSRVVSHRRAVPAPIPLMCGGSCVTVQPQVPSVLVRDTPHSAASAGGDGWPPQWAQPILDAHLAAKGDTLIIDRRGWPARSFECSADPAASKMAHALWFSTRNWPPSRWTLGNFAIPLAPLWDGVLINTAVFSVASVPLVIAGGAVVRARRRARGICALCLYDLRGHAGDRCPECGLHRRGR